MALYNWFWLVLNIRRRKYINNISKKINCRALYRTLLVDLGRDLIERPLTKGSTIVIFWVFWFELKYST